MFKNSIYNNIKKYKLFVDIANYNVQEVYMSPMNDDKIKEKISKWKNVHVHGLDVNMVKISVLPELMYGFNVTSIKILTGFL